MKKMEDLYKQNKQLESYLKRKIIQRIIRENEEKNDINEEHFKNNKNFYETSLPPEPQLPIKTLCESFSKKKSKNTLRG